MQFLLFILTCVQSTVFTSVFCFASLVVCFGVNKLPYLPGWYATHVNGIIYYGIELKALDNIETVQCFVIAFII